MSRCAAFFDMNGTLMRGEPGWEFLVMLHERGHCSDADFAYTQDTLGRFRRHEISNEAAADGLFALICRVVAGRPVADLMQGYAVRHRERLRSSIFPYARALVAALRDRGCLTYAVTNIPFPLLQPLLEDLGLERAIAPEIEQSDGRFTGTLRNWEPGEQGKGHRVRQVVEMEAIDMAASYAFGDGEGDASFLELVGHPVAMNPTPALQAIAVARGWPVVRPKATPDEVVAALGL